MKKLMIFLMIAIPLVIIILINFTVDVVIGNVSISVDRIELDQKEVFANIDDNLSLNATIYPSNATNQEIIWKSTNESVATVDLNGNVSFVGFGTGYITATTVDGNKMASCYYYVTDTIVHEVRLTSPKEEVHVGTSVQLIVTVLPNEAVNKNVTFKSSNEEIATVDSNGKVTGLKPSGMQSVTISAISEDGGHVGTVSLKITKPVEQLNLSTEQAVTAEETYKIGWGILPTDASNKTVTFKIDNPEIATVDNSGVVKFNQVGQVNVEVTSVDGGFTKVINIIYTDGYAQSLTLKQYMISAMINDSPQYIDYTVVPNSIPKTEVTYSSSNEEVAYVANGHLYFVGGGSATITVQVEKAKDEYIQQQIIVYVESPAQDIIIEDVVTAQNTVQLQPQSYPENSTNKDFFYHCNDLDVSVDENGLVTFNTNNSAKTAKIIIYANEDYSNVYKEVNIEYTAGRAKEFSLKNEEISLNYGQNSEIGYNIYPANADVSKINLSITSQVNNSGNGSVIQILDDGSIRGIGGGVATIEVSLVMLGGQLETKTLNVCVVKDVEDIVLSVDLQQQEGIYVTAENVVEFSGLALPEDASNKKINWSVSDINIAVVFNNILTFNQTGIVSLIATTSDGFTKEFLVQYTGSYPLSANVGVMIEKQIFDMPKSIMVGDSYEVVIKDIFPSNTINKSIFLKVSNQSTASLNGKVLSVEDNKFTALAGGSATLSVYISTLILNFDIEVVQMPQEIQVLPENIQTTNSSIQLIATVLPIDTTNKEVEFEVKNSEVAYIENGTLFFKQNGIAQIIVISQADPSIKHEFYIEKIEKGAGNIDPTQDEIEMFVNDSVRLDFSSQGISYDHLEITVTKGQEDGIISLDEENLLLTALTEGQAEIRCDLYDNFGSQIKSFNISITVYQRVEDIVYDGKLELYNNYYTTGLNEIDLTVFKALPESQLTSQLQFEILQSYNSSGVSAQIASIENGNTIKWLASGTLVLKVSANNGEIYRTFNFKYTGGDALSAELNVESEISLSEGQSIEIEVKKWIPADATNVQMYINELSHTAGISVIKIDGNKITALNGGYSQIEVSLSSGITRQIKINVVEFVSSIDIDQDTIVTSSNTVTINAKALPTSATNRTLNYSIGEVEFVTLKNNVLTFTSAGTVIVSISTTDGSNLVKEVSVTCTMGYLHSIELNVTEKTINKNSSFSLYVTQTYPLDAIYKDVKFRILSQQASDGSLNSVVTISDSGLVSGCYGGTAIIRAYSINGLGQEVYTDCIVTVNTPVTSISIEFEDEIEYYQNSIITSKNELRFNQIVYPSDATNQEFIYQVSDNEIATVSEGIIKFLKPGNVTITFISSADTNKYKVYSFYYVGYTLIEATLDTSLFTDNILNLNSGEIYTPVLKTQIPKDNLKVNISITNITENRNYDQLQVISVKDGMIVAENGGSATFDIYANEIYLGTYKIIVFREVENIITDNDEVNYVGVAYFKVEAQVYPLDATDRVFIYSSNNTQIADVDDKGNVSFYKTGRVVITIQIKGHEDIKSEVEIEYTKEIKGISISDTDVEKYVGESVFFKVLPYPADAEGYTVEVYSMNNDVATITQVGDEYRLTGKSAGQVEIVVKVVEKDLEFRKTFTFYTKLSDIILELDNIKDVNGYGGYRVFGNYFIGENGFTNIYQMLYTTQPQNNQTNYAELITWSTSNPEIATVDENGYVKFLNIGQVTITASQKAPYQGANVISKSYTFTVVNGINIYTSQDLDYARANFNKIVNSSSRSYLVLHDNIVVNKPTTGGFYVKENIHGNGYMLDFSNFKSYYKVEIKPGKEEVIDLVFDNVIFRGVTFENGELDELENEGVLITIYDNCKKVVFYNCVIENAMNLVEVFGSNVEFKGCIIRNSFSAGLLLTRNKNSNYIPNVVVEDCIFSRSLLSAIVFSPDKSTNFAGYESKLKLVGHVKIYNWLTLDEFQVDPFIKYFENYGAGSVAQNVIDQIKNNIKTNYPSYKYTVDGKDYYHFGILKIFAEAAGVAEFESNGIIDKSELINQYVTGDIKGSAVASISGIPLPVTLEYSFNMTNYTNQKPAIKPGDTYEGNQTVMADIIQPKNILY